MARSGWLPTWAEELPQTKAALEYAHQMHEGERRPDGSPFVFHPLEVARLLYDCAAPDHLVAAGALHDVIEKTEANVSDVRARFGPRITELVLAVSDDERIHGYAARKAALRQQVAGAGEEALALFAADKLSKLRELRGETAAPNRAGRRREPRTRRLKHYQRSLALLEERLPRSPLVRQLRDDLRDFLRERPELAARVAIRA